MKRCMQGEAGSRWRLLPEVGQTETEAAVEVLLRLPAGTVAYYRLLGEPEQEPAAYKPEERKEEAALFLLCVQEWDKVALRLHTVYVQNKLREPHAEEDALYMLPEKRELWEHENKILQPSVKEHFLEWLKGAKEEGGDNYFRYILQEPEKEPLYYAVHATVFVTSAGAVLRCVPMDITECDNRKQEETTDNERLIFNEITEFAYKLLDGRGDIRTALPILLNKISTNYDFNLATIHVKEATGGKELLEYIWQKEGLQTPEGAAFDARLWKLLETIFAEQRILEYADIEQGKEYTELYCYCRQRGVKALLQSPLYEDGKLIGVVSFADCEKKRLWSSTEKRFLYLTSQILSNYLLREASMREAEERIEQLTGYDEITGLYRYDKFKECAGKLLEEADPGVRYAVVYTDFMNFKFFNELYGFQAGDEVLREFSNLISKYNPRCVAACRNHADHFIVLTRTEGEEELQKWVESYQSIFAANQAEKYMDVTITMTSGAYILEPSEKNIVTALENANLARKIKKEERKGGYLLYKPEMKLERMQELTLLNMLEEAMEDDEIILYLQPKISLADGKLAGAEALARWKKPNGGISMPSEFIPLLEKSGMIVNLDFYMVEALARLLRRFKRRGYPLVPISVNLSRHNIKNRRLVERLAAIAKQYSVPNELIEVEITESAFVEDQEGLMHTIRQIFKEGFEVSIDDFGKGYSSLNMLTEVPASVVKIDKDFLRDSEKSERARKLIVNIIRLIKDSQMKVVCEGVETKEQVDFLREAGCDIVQGFYFARPMRPEEFEERYFVTPSNPVTE